MYRKWLLLCLLYTSYDITFDENRSLYVTMCNIRFLRIYGNYDNHRYRSKVIALVCINVENIIHETIVKNDCTQIFCTLTCIFSSFRIICVPTCTNSIYNNWLKKYTAHTQDHWIMVLGSNFAVTQHSRLICYKSITSSTKWPSEPLNRFPQYNWNLLVCEWKGRNVSPYILLKFQRSKLMWNEKYLHIYRRYFQSTIIYTDVFLNLENLLCRCVITLTLALFTFTERE